MTREEQDFWFELRVEIIDSEKLANMYCDWIEPKTYLSKIRETTIEGEMGFLMPKMKVLTFKLKLTNAPSPISAIVWGNLIPKEPNDTWICQNGDAIEMTL